MKRITVLSGILIAVVLATGAVKFQESQANGQLHCSEIKRGFWAPSDLGPGNACWIGGGVEG